MQNKMYLTFQHPNQHATNEKSTSGFEDFIVKVLEALVPVGNPDFKDQLKNVCFWTIEFDKAEENTAREIGYDKDRNVLLILPLNDNLGYWCNNDLALSDYLKLNAEEITADQFEKDWSCYTTLSV